MSLIGVFFAASEVAWQLGVVAPVPIEKNGGHDILQMMIQAIKGNSFTCKLTSVKTNKRSNMVFFLLV